MDAFDEALDKAGMVDPVQQDDSAFDRAIDARMSPPPHGRPGPLGPIRSFGDTTDAYLASEVGQSQLGPAGFGNLGIRADLGLTDTLEEKRRKFLAYYPGGDLLPVVIPQDFPSNDAGKVVLMYRESPESPYSRFDAPGVPSLTELAGDIADVSQVAPQAAGEIALAAGTSGASLPAQLARIGAGGALGELGRIASEEARGYSDLTAGEAGKKALTAGLFSAGGALLTVPISGVFNIIRGAGALTSRPGAQEAIIAEKLLGLPPLVAAQLTDNPLIRRMAQQSGALTPQVLRVIAAQEGAASDVIPKMFSGADLTMLGTEIGRIEEKTRLALLNAVAMSPTSKESAGRALQQGIQEWNQIARAEVNSLYQAARSIEAPVFDLTPVKSAVEEIRFKIQAGAYDPASPEFDRLLAEVEGLTAQSEFLTDATFGGKTISSIDRLNGLIGRAYDRKIPSGLRATGENKLASDLYAALREAHDAPVNRAPGFDEAWTRAKTSAAKRFDTIEAIEALSSATSRQFAPYQLANDMIKPGSHDLIKRVKSAFNARGLSHRWEPTRQAFRNSLLEDGVENGGQAIRDRLASFDPETLNLILTKAEQADLTSIADHLIQLDKTGLQSVVKGQTANAETIWRLVTAKDSEALGFLLRETGGSDTPAGRAVRAGILDRLGSLMQVSKTQEVVDRRALYAAIGQLRETGASQFLKPDDLKMLEGLETYLRFTRETVDPGTSIIAGGVVQGLAQLSTDAVIQVIHMVGIGRFLTSKTARELLSGKAKERLRFTPLKLAGAILADTQKEIADEVALEKP